MRAEVKVARLYWEDIGVWLSHILVGKYGEIEQVTYSSDKSESAVFYLDKRDGRYSENEITYINTLIEEGIRLVEDTEVFEGMSTFGWL